MKASQVTASLNMIAAIPARWARSKVGNPGSKLAIAKGLAGKVPLKSKTPVSPSIRPRNTSRLGLLLNGSVRVEFQDIPRAITFPGFSTARICGLIKTLLQKEPDTFDFCMKECL